jgi:hypothetical protein
MWIVIGVVVLVVVVIVIVSTTGELNPDTYGIKGNLVRPWRIFKVIIEALVEHYVMSHNDTWGRWV